ncbi:hypothetical protein EDD21DRAFT_389665 [Dissophora ornata]|nr:hypothetical protein EDD21DRAFT_389665 [Dissophora ornata]
MSHPSPDTSPSSKRTPPWSSLSAILDMKARVMEVSAMVTTVMEISAMEILAMEVSAMEGSAMVTAAMEVLVTEILAMVTGTEVIMATTMVHLDTSALEVSSNATWRHATHSSSETNFPRARDRAVCSSASSSLLNAKRVSRIRRAARPLCPPRASIWDRRSASNPRTRSSLRPLTRLTSSRLIPTSKHLRLSPTPCLSRT